MGKHSLFWRTMVVAATVLALSATSVGVSFADQPGAGGVDGDGAKYAKPDSRQDAAYEAKLALAGAYEEYAATGIWDPPASVSPQYVCEFDPCEPNPGPPPSIKTLDTRARQQNNDWYCGPASGQVVINWSRGIFKNNLEGQSTTDNYKTQSVIAGEMGTTNPDGTSGSGVRKGLNKFVLKPGPAFQYDYSEVPAGSDFQRGSHFHSWIVSNVHSWEMPLIPGVKPYKPNQVTPKYHLPNWLGESTAKHWIVIRGYNGFWDGTNVPDVYYSDSTHGAGEYTTGALTMWKVTSFLWNGTVVW